MKASTRRLGWLIRRLLKADHQVGIAVFGQAVETAAVYQVESEENIAACVWLIDTELDERSRSDKDRSIARATT